MLVEKSDDRRVYQGRKVNQLIKQIEDELNGNYKMLQQKEKRKMPFFWIKEYQIEVQVVKDKSIENKPKNESVERILYETIPTPKKVEETNQMSKRKKMVLEILEGNEKEQKNQIKGNNEADKTKEEEMMDMLKTIMKNMKEENKENENTVSQKQETFLESPNEGVLLHFYEKMFDSFELEELAKEIILDIKSNLKEEEWMNTQIVEEKVVERLSKEIKVTNKLSFEETEIMALIGPTGVGKTTTIAKLAAYAVNKNKKVGLITTDVYRIGASEQLQKYADIMGVEMRIANSAEELEAYIDEFKYVYKVDQILIDTVGRSPMEKDLIEEIKEYLDIVKPTHVGLVISATQKNKDIPRIIGTFKNLGVKSLIITKLDETTNHGIIINAQRNQDVSISYITNGQNVPNDIYLADSKALAKKILNGVDEFGSSIISS